MIKKNATMRELLTKLGIGNFNATMIIQSMFMAPATTDPKSAPIILLVRHLQRALNRVGAGLVETGYLDVATAKVLDRVVGVGWESRPWGDVVTAVMAAVQKRKSVGDPLVEPPPEPKTLGFWDPPFLPSVPGGIVTYGIAAIVAHHFWKQRKR